MTEQTNSFFVHPQGLAESDRIGAGTRIWAFAHVMRGAEVGERCNVGEHAFIETGAIVGNDVTVKNGVSVWSGVVIEDDVISRSPLHLHQRSQSAFVHQERARRPGGNRACAGAPPLVRAQ